MADTALRAELADTLAQWGVVLDSSNGGGTALISSGALDSLALFQLSAWIEEKIGHPIDPSSFDLAAEWDTPDGIVGFIEVARDPRTP